MSRPQPDSTAINPHLRREAHWLLQKDKKPYYVTGRPRSGELDSPVDISKLAAYDEAVAALDKRKGKFTGLGFAINRGFQFIDLDKCRNAETGEIEAWAKVLVDKATALGAFVEVSISGTGLHIVGHGRPVEQFRGHRVEVYGVKRFMALGVGVLAIGNDTLPDLTPLLVAMNEAKLTERVKPPLTLVKPALALLWPEERVKAAEILKSLDPDFDYPQWINVGMALHHASGGNAEGLEMWTEWSKGGTKFKDGECAKHWRGFRPGGGITMGTLVHMAQQSPRSVSSRVVEPDPLPPVDTPRRRAEFDDDELMAAEHPEIPWVVEGLIMPGLTLLAAPPKMGKSYLVLQMALCVGAGVPFLGRKTTKMPVSYFDLEEWEELLQRRRKHIGPANGIVRSSVSYALETTGGDVTVLHDIDRHIREKGSKLVIIDLLARVRDELGEDSRKNAYARDYAALRKFADFILQRHPGVAIVLVHHTNKGQHDDWQARISGSQGLAGASHTNMLMTHVDLRGLDDEARAEALRYRKLHVAGKAVEPVEMMVEMMPNGGGWQVTEKTAEDVKTYGKHAHILQILREANGAWVTAKEVHEQVDGTLDSVKKMLMRMAKKGEIQSGGSGGPGYRLPQ